MKTVSRKIPAPVNVSPAVFVSSIAPQSCFYIQTFKKKKKKGIDKSVENSSGRTTFSGIFLGL